LFSPPVEPAFVAVIGREVLGNFRPDDWFPLNEEFPVLPELAVVVG